MVTGSHRNSYAFIDVFTREYKINYYIHFGIISYCNNTRGYSAMNIRTMNIAILGAGNIGTAITDGLLLSDAVTPERLTLTRRNHQRLEPYAEKGCRVTDDNTSAVKAADIIIITVEPRQVDGLLDEIGPALDSARHCIVSVAAGVAISTISERIAAR